MVDSQHCISVVNPLPNLDPSPAWLNHLRCGKSTTYIETSGKSCEKVRKITKPIRENVGKASPFSHLLPTFSHLSGTATVPVARCRRPADGIFDLLCSSALGPRKHSGCLLLRPIPISPLRLGVSAVNFPLPSLPTLNSQLSPRSVSHHSTTPFSTLTLPARNFV